QLTVLEDPGPIGGQVQFTPDPNNPDGLLADLWFWFCDSAAPGLTASDYTVTIDWGDGSSSSVTPSYDPDRGAYFVLLSHTYVGPRSTWITVTITDKFSNVSWTLWWA